LFQVFDATPDERFGNAYLFVRRAKKEKGKKELVGQLPCADIWAGRMQVPA